MDSLQCTWWTLASPLPPLVVTIKTSCCQQLIFGCNIEQLVVTLDPLIWFKICLSLIQCHIVCELTCHLLTPTSDFTCNCASYLVTLSSKQVMKITLLIKVMASGLWLVHVSWYNTKFLQLTYKEMFRSKREEFTIRSWELQGIKSV